MLQQESSPIVSVKVQAIPNLATIENLARLFANANATPASIRQQIFKAADRINSRGERIPGNGLAETGAIIRHGRKILIDVDKYGRWLAGGSK